jgi:hypothetical protein
MACRLNVLGSFLIHPQFLIQVDKAILHWLIRRRCGHRRFKFAQLPAKHECAQRAQRNQQLDPNWH